MAAGNRKKHLEFTFARREVLFSLVNFGKFRKMFLLKLALFRVLKIAGRTAILLMSRTMKIRKLKLFYFQKNARYRAKKL